jgi:hypothetical protein
MRFEAVPAVVAPQLPEIQTQVVVPQPSNKTEPQVVVPQGPCKNRHATWHVDSAAPPVRSKVTPLSPNRYNVLLSFDEAAHEKLCRAQEMLSHLVPSGNPSEIVQHALDALLSERGRRKFGIGAQPREPRAAGTRRSIPAQIRHAVYTRDDGHCAFISKDGVACNSRRKLEFDHVVPLAKGGKTTIENLRLLCRAHNQYEAERAFGREFIEQAKRRA